MEMELTLPIMLLLAFLAWLSHQMIDMQILNKRFIKNNECFRYGKYWTAERFAVGLSWIVIAMFIISYPFVEQEYAPAKANVFKLFASVLTGGIGGFGISYFFGGTKKWLARKIDEKLNLKDDEEPK